MKKILVLAAMVGALACTGEVSTGALVISAINSSVSQNFDSLTTSGTSISGLDTGGWRLAAATPTWTGTTTTTVVAQSAAFNGSSGGNNYNLGTTSDRALGFLNSGSFTSPRSIMLEVSNTTGKTLTQLDISFDYEKYRSGTRAFDFTFFHSGNGSTWTSATGGDQSYAADANNTVAGSPINSVAKSFSISGLSIANNATYYLRWTLTGVGGSSNGQAIGIDNVSISAVPEPSALLLVGSIIGAGLLRRRRA